MLSCFRRRAIAPLFFSALNREAIRMCAFCFLILAGPANVVWAQQTINNASISGRVTDPSGAVVSGAGVTAKQTDTNITSSATTDSDGRFRFSVLPVGEYEVMVRQEGFANAIRSVTLTVGAAFDLPIILTVGPSESKV